MKHHFLLLIISLIFTACQPESGPAGLSISADKTAFTADGTDKVRFNVTYNGKDVTETAIITVQGSGNVQNATFSTIKPGTYKVSAMHRGETSEILEITAIAPNGTLLVADRLEIEANGRDSVSFTVLYEGKDVTSSALIKYNDGEQLPRSSFRTETIGKYIFSAVYDNVSGNTIEINAVKPKLELISDKNFIWPDGTDKAVFSVKYDDNDVSSSSKLYIDDGKELKGLEFSSDNSGEFVIYAEYDGFFSNKVRITASTIKLVSDKTTVPAGAGQAVRLYVMRGDANVSAESKLTYDRTGESITLDGDHFSFITTDEYVDTFTAEYDGDKSTMRLLKEPQGNFFKRVAIAKTTGTWCGWCHPAAVELDKLLETGIADSVTLFNAHGDDIMETKDSDLFCGFLNELNGTHTSRTFPLVTMDYRKIWENESAEIYANAIREAHSYGTNCGIAISSEISGNTLDINVTLWSSQDKEYFVSVCLLENGIIADQTSYITEDKIVRDYEHNDILRIMDSPDYGKSWGTIKKFDQKSMNYKFDATGYDLSKCDIMILATCLENSEKYINNSVRCKAGENINFTIE